MVRVAASTSILKLLFVAFDTLTDVMCQDMPERTWMLKKVMVFLVLAVALTGCSATQTYRAVELPAALQAPPAVFTSRLDLSHLGGAVADHGVIQPRDILTVAVSAGDETGDGKGGGDAGFKLPVADDGTVDVPLVGRVKVSGLALENAAVAIRQASVQRQLYVSPTVLVGFHEKRLVRVTVAGAVESPGEYEFRAGTCTVASALMAAGGLTEKAQPDVDVQIPSVSTADAVMSGAARPRVLTAGLDDSATRLNRSKIVRVSLVRSDADSASHWNALPDGAVVTVPELPDRYISVIGITQNKTLELPYGREYRVLDAIAAAGGPRYSTWIANKIKVLRPDPATGETVAIKLTIGEAKSDQAANIALAAGDVVSVEETPLTFTLSTIGQLLGIGLNTARGVAVSP